MTYSLHQSQDRVLNKVFGSKESLFPGTELVLAGGTALSRYYLHHRTSYDLDFFVGTRFDPMLAAAKLKGIGMNLMDPTMENTPLFAAQLHGYVDIDGERMKVSFVEDVFTGMFPVVVIKSVRTETIEGLYHRKLRTITGTAEVTTVSGAITNKGARQTARDLFDLYVLGREVTPIGEFIAKINAHGANVPEDALERGIRAMPWMDLMDEFDRLEKAEQYNHVTAYDVKRYFDTALGFGHNQASLEPEL